MSDANYGCKINCVHVESVSAFALLKLYWKIYATFWEDMFANLPPPQKKNTQQQPNNNNNPKTTHTHKTHIHNNKTTTKNNIEQQKHIHTQTKKLKQQHRNQQ